MLWGHVEEILLLNNFFLLSIRALVAKIWPDKVVRLCPWRIFGEFLGPVFLASHLQHISDLHSKFALGPDHVSKYGRSILRPLRLGEEKKKIEGKKIEETTGQKYNGLPCSIGRP